MFEYHTAAIYWALQKSKEKPVIIDRWWPSEKVYADAYRNGSQWPLAYRMFERIAHRFGLSYVFCLPSDREAYLNFYNELKQSREEMYSSGMEKVYDGYSELFMHFNASREGVTHYDFMKEGHLLDDVCQGIISTAFDIRSSIPGAADDLSATWFSGNIVNPYFVFVDAQDTRAKARRKLFSNFGYDFTNSQFAGVLEELGIYESDLVFVSLDGERDGERFEFIKNMGKPVIASGALTELILTANGIDVLGTIHKPSYNSISNHAIIKNNLKKVLS